MRSIVDRFLEHSRVFYFENACQPEIFVGSADWMPRNFFRRIEVVFPVEDGNLRERITNELFSLALSDNVKARFLQADGSYTRPALKRGNRPCRSQLEFIALTLNETRPGKKHGPSRTKYPVVKVKTRPVGPRG